MFCWQLNRECNSTVRRRIPYGAIAKVILATGGGAGSAGERRATIFSSKLMNDARYPLSAMAANACVRRNDREQKPQTWSRFDIQSEDDKEAQRRFRKMAPRAGLEPATQRLTAACSTC